MAQILLIESDRILAQNILRALKHSGHSVDWQVDPQAALGCADANIPDIIILDLVLAGRGGVEFLYEFRSYPDWQGVPIVLFSSLSAQELVDSLDCFEHLNIAAYHYKPTTALSSLIQTIQSVIPAGLTVIPAKAGIQS